VGGRPILLRDSVILGSVDTEGQASFNVGRNPRTAAGVASDGKRLILTVVDGRQRPYSDGMSLRELAVLLRALGARDAINLDGGGSTTFVYADPNSGGALRIGNRPSDAGGERAVGDALAIVHRSCVSGG
jgi:exopolysaccharide biosynthesis protein